LEEISGKRKIPIGRLIAYEELAGHGNLHKRKKRERKERVRKSREGRKENGVRKGAGGGNEGEGRGWGPIGGGKVRLSGK